MFIKLPRGKKIELDFDESVYSPAHSDIGTVVLADLYLKDSFTVVDVGCGSGLLGLSIKKLHPKCEVICTDISEAALTTTKNNAKKNKLDILVHKRSLLEMSQNVDMVVSNLPTFNLEQMDQALFGPKESYLAPQNGLGLYSKLFKQAKTALKPGGYLIVECQERLQDDLRNLSEREGFHLINRTDFSFAFINPLR